MVKFIFSSLITKRINPLIFSTNAERYEVTLGATESKVCDLEQEVLQSLKEMGFTL